LADSQREGCKRNEPTHDTVEELSKKDHEAIASEYLEENHGDGEDASSKLTVSVTNSVGYSTSNE